jgi:hypothetical protein
LERTKQSSEEGSATRVGEIETLRSDLEKLQLQNQDVEMERDELREDVNGWRVRVKNLETALATEKANLEAEKKENTLAREKIRKLGDRLQAAANDTKVTEELKDQVFKLASTLEKERKDWELTRTSLESDLRKEREEFEQSRQHLLALLEVERSNRVRGSGLGDMDALNETADGFDMTRVDPCSVGLKGMRPVSSNGSNRSSFGPTSSSSSSHLSSFGFSLASDSQTDMSYSSDDECSKFTAPLDPYHNQDVIKSGLNDFNTGLMSLGGLQTLTEEDEEEECSPKEVSSVEPLAVIESTNLVPIQCGSSPQPSTQRQHQRQESFVKKWSFPKGPVVRNFEVEEHHSFFGLNADHPVSPSSNSCSVSNLFLVQTLPPLPFSEATSLPSALMAGLSIEESLVTPSHIRRPSSPQPVGPLAVPKKPFSAIVSPPPTAYSAHLTRTSQSSQHTDSVSVASSAGSSLAKRLSLQSFTTLFGSYTNLSPTATSLAVGASRLCSTADDPIERDSSFDLTRPLITKRVVPQASPTLSGRGSARFISPNQQPLPVSSSYSVLDFTASCPCNSERVINV